MLVGVLGGGREGEGGNTRKGQPRWTTLIGADYICHNNYCVTEAGHCIF